MHTHVVLHLACVVAAGASPGNIRVDISRVGDIPVDLGHVLIKTALLDEVLRADRAYMGLFSGMLLLVVVHGVLLGCSEIAIIEGACKLTCLVLDIHYGCHAFVGGPRAPLQVFIGPAPSLDTIKIAFQSIRCPECLQLVLRPWSIMEPRSTPLVASPSRTWSRTSTAAL